MVGIIVAVAMLLAALVIVPIKQESTERWSSDSDGDGLVTEFTLQQD